MKKYKNLIIYFIIFLLICIYYLTALPSWGEFWSYSFVYYISKGYIPYLDYNMIITPLYPLLLGLIGRIIGSNFYVFIILNAIITTLIVKEVNDKKEDYLLAFLLLLLIKEPGYNLFLLFLYYLIIKYKDSKYLFGLLVSLLFLTKQNIGAVFFILMIILSKYKLKNLITFIIPILFISLYLIINKAFYSFIDEAFLGLLNFGKNNTHLLFIVLIIVIPILCHIIYMYIKKRNNELLFIGAFLLLSFPIFDLQHLLIACFPYFIYISTKGPKLKYVIHFTLLVVAFLLINWKGVLPNRTNLFKYVSISKGLEERILNVNSIINDNKDKKIFLITGLAPIYKIENNIKPTRYDLINKDNLGYNGTKKYIKYINDTCNKEKCLFIYTDINWQMDLDIQKYVVANYTKIKETDGIYIYEN